MQQAPCAGTEGQLPCKRQVRVPWLGKTTALRPIGSLARKGRRQSRQEPGSSRQGTVQGQRARWQVRVHWLGKEQH